MRKLDQLSCFPWETMTDRDCINEYDRTTKYGTTANTKCKKATVDAVLRIDRKKLPSNNTVSTTRGLANEECPADRPKHGAMRDENKGTAADTRSSKQVTFPPEVRTTQNADADPSAAMQCAERVT